MIHPSYNELIEIINQDRESEDAPEINSRYSIVMAAAKRARQIIDGQQPLVDKVSVNKPLTIAVEELRRGKIKVREEGEDDFQMRFRKADTGIAEGAFDEESEQAETEDAE